MRGCVQVAHSSPPPPARSATLATAQQQLHHQLSRTDMQGPYKPMNVVRPLSDGGVDDNVLVWQLPRRFARRSRAACQTVTPVPSPSSNNIWSALDLSPDTNDNEPVGDSELDPTPDSVAILDGPNCNATPAVPAAGPNLGSKCIDTPSTAAVHLIRRFSTLLPAAPVLNIGLAPSSTLELGAVVLVQLICTLALVACSVVEVDPVADFLKLAGGAALTAIVVAQHADTAARLRLHHADVTAGLRVVGRRRKKRRRERKLRRARAAADIKLTQTVEVRKQWLRAVMGLQILKCRRRATASMTTQQRNTPGPNRQRLSRSTQIHKLRSTQRARRRRPQQCRNRP